MTDSMDYVLSGGPLSPGVLHSLDRQRSTGHRAVMRMLPDGLDSAAPRAAGDTLWHAADDALLVRTRGTLRPPPGTTVAARPVHLPDAGDVVGFDVDVEAAYTPGASVPDELWDAGHRGFRSAPRKPVSHDDLAAWAERKLRRSGFDPHRLTATGFRAAVSGGFVLPAAHLHVRAEVIDRDAAGAAVTRGLGRGRSYGLALIRFTDKET